MWQALLKIRVEDKLRHVAMIRVIVVGTMREDHIRIGFAKDVDHQPALFPVGKDMLVHDSRPDEPSADDL